MLVDGVFAPQLSDIGDLDKGAHHSHAARGARRQRRHAAAQLFSPDNANPMVSLNGAFATDGVVIDVADGAVLSHPLHIVHVATSAAPSAMFTRSLLRLGKMPRVTLVESFVAAEGAKAYQAHDSLVVAIGDNARLDRSGWSRTPPMPSTSRPRS